jgi:hypothetical protein
MKWVTASALSLVLTSGRMTKGWRISSTVIMGLSLLLEKKDGIMARMYSGLSIGLFRQKTRFCAEESDFYEIDHTKEKYIHKYWTELTGQFTFVGFSVRLKRFKFYSELGYGCRGLYTAGAKYTF